MTCVSACAGLIPGNADHARFNSADHGTIRTVSIPAVHSGFRARHTIVYVPAAARHRGARLPVVMLLGGNPSAPRDWTAKWQIGQFLDRFAAAHHGQAPIVVMPDENGTYRGDTECVDSPRGEAEQYLTVDVPDYVRSHYPVRASRWGIAGVSEGGMCATVLALRHPTVFRAFVNMSGLARPSIAEQDSEQPTVRALFGGSQSAFEAHDAVRLLRSHRYSELSGWLGAGRADTGVLQAQAAITAAAQPAHVPMKQVTLPGAHSLGLWLRMLPGAFQWLWQQLR
jgi:S-formylglutathione hydrolase FrmB